VVAKTLWAGLRARPGPLTRLSYLTCKVKAPDDDDYKKLVRMISYIKGTINLPLRLSVDGSRVVKWWVDAWHATRKACGVRLGEQCLLDGVVSIAHPEYKNSKL
jgi:hypothetical protein